MGCTLFFLKELLSGSSSTLNNGWGLLSLFKMLKTGLALNPLSSALVISAGVTSDPRPFNTNCVPLLLFSWYTKKLIFCRLDALIKLYNYLPTSFEL